MRRTPGGPKPVVPVKVKPSPTPSAQPAEAWVQKMKARQGFHKLTSGPKAYAKRDLPILYLTRNIGQSVKDAAGEVRSATRKK